MFHDVQTRQKNKNTMIHKHVRAELTAASSLACAARCEANRPVEGGEAFLLNYHLKKTRRAGFSYHFAARGCRAAERSGLNVR